MKLFPKEPFVPSELGKPHSIVSLNNALGITDKRHDELGFIIEHEICHVAVGEHLTKATALTRIQTHPGMNDVEKCYCSFKLYEYLLKGHVPRPLWGYLERI